MQTHLTTHIVEPQQKASASIIWLHGLGATGADLIPLTEQFSLANNIRHVFPTAPMRPVTCNDGMVMPAWYDILAVRLMVREDEVGILDAEQQLLNLIQTEQQFVPSDRIVLAGFSQGGALALYTGIHFSEKLAGIVALSSYLPLRNQRPIAKNALHTPIFLSAGSMDKVVQSDWSLATKDYLQERGFDQISWHLYPKEHSICLEECQDLLLWLKQILEKDDL